MLRLVNEMIEIENKNSNLGNLIIFISSLSSM